MRVLNEVVVNKFIFNALLQLFIWMEERWAYGLEFFQAYTSHDPSAFSFTSCPFYHPSINNETRSNACFPLMVLHRGKPPISRNNHIKYNIKALEAHYRLN